MNDKFSKIGFILAVAGGAVGLGNAWKFPTLVGQNGGSAFVLLYLALTLGVGFSIFLAEMALGRLSGRDLPSAYETLAPRGGRKWRAGGVFIAGGMLVLSFYLVILGWVIRYIFLGFSPLPATAEEAGAVFDDLISHSLATSLGFYALALVLTLSVVARGIKSGIERLNVVMMPLLFVLLLAMLAYACTMQGFGAAAKFLFYPDFGKITVSSILSALGLALFTLCVGVGCIAAYAASLSEGVRLVRSSVNIVFTFIFEFRADPAQGAGLVFVSLTTMFAKMGVAGQVLEVAFFVSLFFAGITSAVSMIEPFVFYLIGRFKISRLRAVCISGCVIAVLGACSLLSMHADYASRFKLFGASFFDCLDFVSSNVMLPLGALTSAIFVGFAMDTQRLRGLFGADMGELGFKIWYFSLRFVAPVAIVIIMANLLFFSGK